MYLIDNVYLSILKLVKLNRFNWKEFRSWVKTVNPEWLRYISRRGFYYYQFKSVLKGFAVVVASNTSFGNALKKAIKR